MLNSRLKRRLFLLSDLHNDSDVFRYWFIYDGGQESGVCPYLSQGKKNTRNLEENRVVNVDQTGVGMIVDGVSEVLTVPESAVEEAPAITSTVNSIFITGIAKLDNRLVNLLDLEKILSAQEQQNLIEAVK